VGRAIPPRCHSQEHKAERAPAARTHKDVDGCLRVDVVKGQALVVLVHNVGRDLLADDF